jgi:hypothetical protein
MRASAIINNNNPQISGLIHHLEISQPPWQLNFFSPGPDGYTHISLSLTTHAHTQNSIGSRVRVDESEQSVQVHNLISQYLG